MMLTFVPPVFWSRPTLSKIGCTAEPFSVTSESSTMVNVRPAALLSTEPLPPTSEPLVSVVEPSGTRRRPPRSEALPLEMISGPVNVLVPVPVWMPVDQTNKPL